MTDHTFPIDELLRRLHLANARRTWRALVSRAEKESWSYEHFLGTLVAEEVAHRKGTRLRRLSSVAHFPFLKTIDDFDFTFQSTLRLQMLGSYLSPDFVTQGGSLILIGKTGRGKTHLAIAIAYRAIQNGFDARFVTAAELIDELALASREGRLREALTSYTRPDVLVVDEVGYLAHDPDAANVLFHVVNERHLKKRAMVFTTNKELSVWGQVLHDNDLGEAIVDRILERGRLIRLDGPSIRSRHLDSSDLSPLGAESPVPETQPNRPEFPEQLRPEFPEPTGDDVGVDQNGTGQIAPNRFERGIVPCLG